MNERQNQYRKQGIISSFEIQGFNEECEIEIGLLMNFIKNISCDKNIFVEIYGDVCSVNAEAVIYLYEEPKKLFLMRLSKLQIDLNKLNNINELFQNRTTFFYITDYSFNWNDFLVTKTIKMNYLFKKNILLSKIALSDVGYPTIYVNEASEYYMRNLFEQFQQHQYTFKN